MKDLGYEVYGEEQAAEQQCVLYHLQPRLGLSARVCVLQQQKNDAEDFDIDEPGSDGPWPDVSLTNPVVPIFMRHRRIQAGFRGCCRGNAWLNTSAGVQQLRHHRSVAFSRAVSASTHTRGQSRSGTSRRPSCLGPR